MTRLELVADSDVISYIHDSGPLGKAYSDLIGTRRTGITLLSIAESRQGAVYANWGKRRITGLHDFSDAILRCRIQCRDCQCLRTPSRPMEGPSACER
jgi:hypothetical protein